MIQIYTGEGKGKTTAALGLAIRASGAGLRVYIGQFNKGRQCSEHIVLNKINNIKVEQFGTCRFIKKISPLDIKHARLGLAQVKKAISSKKYNMVILDEINFAIKLGLLDVGSITAMLRQVPKTIEIVLTGRSVHPDLIKLADLVSEIREVKHYYSQGVCARKGIEF